MISENLQNYRIHKILNGHNSETIQSTVLWFDVCSYIDQCINSQTLVELKT